MRSKTEGLLKQIKGCNSVVDGKFRSNALAILLILHSDRICELQLNSCNIVTELIESGLIKFSDGSDRVGGKIFFKDGRLHSLTLTLLGEACAQAILEELADVGIIFTSEK